MDILTQRINYAKIALIKNYSIIPEEEPLDEGTINTLVGEFNAFMTNDYSGHRDFKISDYSKIEYVNMYPKKERGAQTRFYHIDKKEKIAFESVFKSGETYDTTNERHIKRHFSNPFAQISLITEERSIKIKGDKLVVKSYKQIRFRDFNCKYFKKNSSSSVFSFNLKTGNIIFGESTSRAGVKTRRFRQNSFSLFNGAIYRGGFTKMSNNEFNKKSNLYNEYVKEMDDTVFLKTMFEQLGQPLPNNFNLNESTIAQQELRDFLMGYVLDFFIKAKKIKVPNDYSFLIYRYYPGEKFLKKNDRKLVQAVADSFGIKNKSTVKILHENPKLDILTYKDFSKYFGEKFPKYFSSLTNEAKQVFYLTGNDALTTQGSIPIEDRKKHDLVSRLVDDQTKENIIKILNEVNSTTKTHGMFGLIRDHIDMIEKINEYDPNIKWRATNYTDFHNEHMEFTKIISLMKKGWTHEYVFDNRMVRKVEEPITILGDDLITRTFKPQILKREEEYAEEGAFMHHCVAGYANKESSIIVSVRLNDGLERVTCEYEKKTGACHQERYFCNKIPPAYFNEALEILRERVVKFSYQRLLNHIELKKVRVKINGIEVPVPERRDDPYNLINFIPELLP